MVGEEGGVGLGRTAPLSAGPPSQPDSSAMGRGMASAGQASLERCRGSGFSTRSKSTRRTHCESQNPMTSQTILHTQDSRWVDEFNKAATCVVMFRT